MKIVQLTAENTLRLKAIEIKPDGNTVVIGGRNGAGKSSVLNAIEMALAGTKSIPNEPIRHGEEKAHVRLDLGDIIVERRFTAGGSSLVVSSREGLRHTSPQAVLDALVGKLSFDPMRFFRMDAKAQLSTLRELAGVDTTELDKQEALARQKRTDINRIAEKWRKAFEAAPEHKDAPDEEVSVADLTKQLQERQKANASKADARRAHAKAHEEWRINSQEAERLEKALDGARAVVAACKARADEAAARAESMPDADEQSVMEQLQAAEGINRKWQANRQRDGYEVQAQEAEAEANGLTDDIRRLGEAKRKLLESAKFAVPGLTFDDGGVKFNAVPFGQASTAEQLRVSVAIGLAMNPRLKVLLIRDGSLLDDESMELIAKQAAVADAQLWIEKVSSTGDGCNVVIEDGAIRNEEEHLQRGPALAEAIAGGGV